MAALEFVELSVRVQIPLATLVKLKTPVDGQFLFVAD